MYGNAPVSNNNDFKVVAFHNSTEHHFTPEQGCMFDGRPIHGKDGMPGIAAGETMILPYHVGQQLAINLAKRVLNTSPAASVDAAGNPVGVAVWDENLLIRKKQEYLKELYNEEKPIAQTETDKLMAKVEEYRKMVETLITNPEIASKIQGLANPTTSTPSAPATSNAEPVSAVPKATDNPDMWSKKDVSDELKRRNVEFNGRQSKEDLMKLLV